MPKEYLVGAKEPRKAEMIGSHFSSDPRLSELFVRLLAKDPDNFNASIDDKDEMYLDTIASCAGDRTAALWNYFDLGRQMWDEVLQIISWAFGDGYTDSTFSMMDFACGYGRVTRFLVQDLAPERIWASDLYADAVRFQIEQFGVNGVVSTVTPDDYQNAHRFDAIFVASLFSHLPERTFRSWLRKLYQLLTPRGILIFSVHDMRLKPPDLAVSPAGIGFVAMSESATLDPESYGSSFVTERFVQSCISDIPHSVDASRHIERGLAGYQDLYIVSRDLDRDMAALDFNFGPSGSIDYCRREEGGELKVTGWATDLNRSTHVTEVQLLINGQVFRRCRPTMRRPDVARHFQTEKGLDSGWTFDVPGDAVSSGDIITVKIINSGRFDRLLLPTIVM